MGLTFTAIPEDTFENLQLNAGVLVKSFSPENPVLDKGNIVCATTGGLQVNAVPTFTDLGEDIDNCPKNVKELKNLDFWEASIAFTSLGVSKDIIKMALGAADTSGNKVTPRNTLEQSDFAASIWWIGDIAGDKFVAVELKNALSTAGLQIKTTDKGKGQLAVTLTGHYSISAQDTVPIAYYLGEVTGD